MRISDWSSDVCSSDLGMVLINAANSGLDQDTTQRLLACDSAKQVSRALYWSVLASIPVILIFLFIGSLLYIFYERPDLMAAIPGQTAPTFQGEQITVFKIGRASCRERVCQYV